MKNGPRPSAIALRWKVPAVIGKLSAFDASSLIFFWGRGEGGEASLKNEDLYFIYIFTDCNGFYECVECVW